MVLEKPQLFSHYREFILLSMMFLTLISIRLFNQYTQYQEFITKPFYYTYANVEYIYQKPHYSILKLHTEEGLTLFSGVANKIDYSNSTLRLEIFPDSNLTFVKYMSGFYIKSRIKKRIKNKPNHLKEFIKNSIKSQHSNSNNNSDMIEFYNAIFLASKISKEFREKIASLGVSHLIALSGLHLTTLWGVIYLLLLYPYKFFQRRFFPYRNALFDVGLISIIILGVYTIFVGSPPSLIRSFVMMLSAWIFLLMGIKIFSFESLALIILLILSIDISYIFSIAFWFSVAGVFYIFLIERYTQNIKNRVVKYTIFPMGIYLFMLPITHIIFYTTNIYQLTSIILSTLFTFFYPVSIFLHIIGFGGVFDEVLIALFKLPSTQISFDMILPLDIFIIYLIISIGAIWSSLSFYLLILVAIINIILLYNWDLIYLGL
ncbi:Competence protein [hydrothermal vent metagenome]|uniref:Competence protein n=1 Tax=hydrothermal vent metagenome TaxID=652676 RepID=A0A1W1EJ78_9ZZZZ